MARLKSLIARTEIDIVQRSHSCQRNANHKLKMGERRMKVHENRSPDNYCITCSIEIVKNDIQKLNTLLIELESNN
jgi:hypothetical protein